MELNYRGGAACFARVEIIGPKRTLVSEEIIGDEIRRVVLL